MGCVWPAPRRQHPDPDRQLVGYTVTDYLLHHATTTRRHERGPASLWTALRDHLTHPDDLHAIATGGLDRRLYTIAIPLLRSRADAGDPEAAYQLAELLAAAEDDRLHRFGFDVHGEIADGPAW
ncbi:hypothetical protein AB1484_23010 [Parafrankia sp. FMc6]|uniref:hypothetical protein n=1 Tax=Parafrankia soli TaxID=2599596 RepID=UPI0034D3ACC0